MLTLLLSLVIKNTLQIVKYDVLMDTISMDAHRSIRLVLWMRIPMKCSGPDRPSVKVSLRESTSTEIMIKACVA